MAVVFKGEAHYPDMHDAYSRYTARTRKKDTELGGREFSRVVKRYCKSLAARLEKEGFVSLPCQMGSLAVTRYKYRWKFSRGGKVHGKGKVDWQKTRELWETDAEACGSKTMVMSPDLYTTAIVYVPNWNSISGGLRVLGFRANRQLYRRIAGSVAADIIDYKVLDYDKLII